GASKDEIAVLKQAVFNMGLDAAAVISSSTTIELLASDAKALAGTIRNQIIGPWVLFNFGPNDAVPLFKFHYEEKEDLDATAKVYTALVSMGFKDIGMKHIHERFGIPVPEAGEETLKTYIGGSAGTDSMAAINNNANAVSVNKATLPTSGTDTMSHTVDAFLEQLQTESNQGMADLFDPINKLMNDVSSLDELRDKILDTYKEMDAAALGGLIERAMAAAELAGRYEVKFGKRTI
ncbi:phage portal protein family protein, partial [Candidatus Magnetominusculus dajiuhuensis]|uniref:phage portal protein family protein n=1 Tax=Candidatus Magnetominusculus dajiuhuensis TaxID=3137712 RepID=UPI003B427FAD